MITSLSFLCVDFVSGADHIEFKQLSRAQTLSIARYKLASNDHWNKMRAVRNLFDGLRNSILGLREMNARTEEDLVGRKGFNNNMVKMMRELGPSEEEGEGFNLVWHEQISWMKGRLNSKSRYQLRCLKYPW